MRSTRLVEKPRNQPNETGLEPGMKKPRASRAFDGRYWARTSDPQLVELVLSQLS
jgi:hypothetical protein